MGVEGCHQFDTPDTPKLVSSALGESGMTEISGVEPFSLVIGLLALRIGCRSVGGGVLADVLIAPGWRIFRPSLPVRVVAAGLDSYPHR